MNQTVWETILPTGQRLQIVHGDLTDERVDAIVNAANSHLRHGGGVAGAIVRPVYLVSPCRARRRPFFPLW